MSEFMKLLESYIDSESIEAPERLAKNLCDRLQGNCIVSYAQNYEDIILNRIFNDETQGFYVDVGAFHPYSKSISCLFYLKGWSGINIDLCDENISRFKRHRRRDINIQAAVGREHGMLEYYVQPGTPRSTALAELGKDYARRGNQISTQTLETWTLTELLDKHNVPAIDFLNVDVEGAEEDVFVGLDFNRYRPKIILAEATYPEKVEPNWLGWEPILMDAGFECVYFDGLNRFYACDSSGEIREACNLPPNYFDDFVRYDYVMAIASALNNITDGT